MDRTWLCSVLFMDIAQYSSQSVELQMKWKTRFNTYLSEAIQDVPKDERVILDTGDGAAVCFLGSPEAAMFAALHLWQCFVRDEREQPPGLRVRIGVNLGPVKLVKDLNGSLNAIGDGINAGQRIMSFAPENQILVSQSFYEVVSRLSDDYKALFKLKGVERDKHVREHTVYSLVPPGSEEWHAAAAAKSQSTPSQPAEQGQTPTAPQTPAPAIPPALPPKRSPVPLVIGGALVILVAAAGAWYFAAANKTPGPAVQPVASAPPASQNAAPPSQGNAKPSAEPASQRAPTPAIPAVKLPDTPPSTAPKNEIAPAAQTAELKVATEAKTASAAPAEPKVSAQAEAAYNQGMQLLDQDKPSEAVPHFDDAIRANPDYALAYLGRAEARRKQGQYESSIEDCNHAMRIGTVAPRAYFCRGLSEGLLEQYDLAARDHGEAIRLNPKFGVAYDNRANARINLRQYDLALEDLNQAIRIRPNNVQSYLRRAGVYENLKQYDKAIQDYDQVIRLQPNNARAYNGRANAKNLSGDGRGAAADRRYARQLKNQ
ncbi:MAG TPA: tetratricopeptide repeat protein [Bryobacteraceae bacterium]|nr:tetratricopeptide repeat protein [Bryobacteraceae bacterium]